MNGMNNQVLLLLYDHVTIINFADSAEGDCQATNDSASHNLDERNQR